MDSMEMKSKLDARINSLRDLIHNRLVDVTDRVKDEVAIASKGYNVAIGGLVREMTEIHDMAIRLETMQEVISEMYVAATVPMKNSPDAKRVTTTEAVRVPCTNGSVDAAKPKKGGG